METAPILSVFDPFDGGVCDAEDVLFDGMPIDKMFEQILIFKKGASEADSPLVALITDGENLPIIVDSPKILIEWDNGRNRIFRI